MRIALMLPAFYPEVTRGTERVAHDAGVALARRGHEVTVLTTHPGPSVTTPEQGMRVVRTRRLRAPARLRCYEDHLLNAPGALWRLLREDFDVAHAFFPVEAWAALRARRHGGPPVVFSFHGLPQRRYLVNRRYRLELISSALAGSDVATVLSEAAADACRRYLQVDPVVLPGGLRLADFSHDARRNERPTLFCASSLADPAKRAELLFEAFGRLRGRRPGVRLVVAPPRDPARDRAAAPLGPPEGVEVLRVGPAELPRLYGGAWASVLAAVNEPFGLVLIESLAAGTPVIAARSGACPEVVDESVGRLFDADDAESLALAMEAGLELGASPDVAAACRARAARFDWDRLVLEHERVYEKALAPPSRAGISP